jgi:Tol biopolymer transport system component
LQRVPPGASEQAARTDGSEIWIVNLDGSGQQQIAAQAGFVVDWAPDSQSLVYGARILADDAQDPQAPARTQLTQVNADGSRPQMLVDDAQALALQPLGWSAGGERFYSAAYTSAGWALNYWDRAKQAQVNGEPVAQDGQVRSFSLSPDGQRLLLDVLVKDGEELILYNIPDGARQTVSQMPSTAPAGAHLSALWSADGQRLLIGNPSEAPAQQMRVFVPDGPDFAPSPFQQPSTPQSSSLTPLRWSPDGAWIVLRDYTAADLPVYLQHAGETALTRLPQQKAGAGLTVYGWTTP